MELEATNKGKKNLPFAVNERRLLTIRAERIAPKYLVSDPNVSPSLTVPPSVEAICLGKERYPTHESRLFQLEIEIAKLGIIQVQLNHGNPADDAARLAAIAEDLLTEDHETGIHQYGEAAKDKNDIQASLHSYNPAEGGKT